MVAIPWRLGFVLAFSVVVSRPSATIRTGSPDSGWWGTEEAKQLISTARKQIVAANYAAAENIFANALDNAKKRGDRIATARLLSGIGGARMARFDYEGALSAYLEAKHAAESSADWLDLGAIDLNLAGLYEQVWDLSAAIRAAEEGRATADKVRGAYYRAEALLQIGRLHAERRDLDPSPFFAEAIEAARMIEWKAAEADGWSLLGNQRLSRGELRGAEEAFGRAFYLRRVFADSRRYLGRSYEDLGALRLAEATIVNAGPLRLKLLDQAERFTASAQDEYVRGTPNILAFELLQQRGRILLLRGDVTSALEDLRQAVQLAVQWRPGMATAELQQDAFTPFVEAAADYGLKTRKSEWIAASFLAEETTRASNLRDSSSLVEAWRRKLPTQFWTTLAELRAEQDRLRRAGVFYSQESDRLQLELIAMEAGAGIGLNLEKNRENFAAERSLIQYQRVLRDSSALFSFELGEKQSFVWAVTGNSLNVYRLPSKERILKLVKSFRDSLEADDLRSQALGKELYEVLFSQLTRAEAGKKDWLMSPSDGLLQLPFAALVSESDSGHTATYLAESHTVTIVAGPVSRGFVAPVPANGRFIAVGDPIYNTADPRWKRPRSWFGGSTYAEGGQLNRLPGSGREVELSSEGWQSATVLKGVDASTERFLKELNAGSDSTPAVIHLATHVFTGGTKEAFLAFALSPGGQPELLGTTDVALLRAPGSLVVMSGCDSAGGDVRASIGLANLTRAWALAGAAAVVATQWPVRDSGGEFLVRFYRYLRNDHPAEALRKAQVDAIRSGTVASSPSNWATYQVYGGAQ